MKSLALTQTALHERAKQPGGLADLRRKRAESRRLRTRLLADDDKRMTEPDGLTLRFGVALGEVAA